MKMKSLLKRTVSVSALLLMSIFLSGCSDKFILLKSSGTVGEQQSWLILFVAAMALIVIIPVIILAVVIPFKYREGNKKAKYDPEFSDSAKLEFIWWSIPVIIVIIIGTITWKTTHELDPRVPLKSDKEAIRIEAISLQWKWLFLYPEEGIATVNHIKIPKDTPIDFHITSNGTMNGFWIPELGGQIYAMAGMETQLYLDAKKIGTFTGRGANFTGGEFAKQTFIVDSVSDEDYDSWVKSVQEKDATFTNDLFMELQVPGLTTESYYSKYPSDLFFNIMDMNSSGMEHENGSDHESHNKSENPLYPIGKEHTH